MSTRQAQSTRTSAVNPSSSTSSSTAASSKRGSLAVEAKSTYGASSTAAPPTRKLGLWGSSTTSHGRLTPVPSVKSTPRPLWSSSRANSTDSTTSNLAGTTPGLKQNRIAFGLGTQAKATPSRPLSRQSTTATPSTIKPLSQSAPPVRMSELTVDNEPSVLAQAPQPSVGLDCEKRGMEGYDPEKEPIKAYLRIRPPPANASLSVNYVQVVSDSEVLMSPPADHRLNSSSSTLFSGPLLRTSALQLHPSSHPSLPDDAGPVPIPSSPAPFGSVYKFTKVFAPSETTPETSQADFFKATTLPLVHDFLKGENCLLFAYGTTGSGKTWTVQGEEGEKAGLLPRVMDVVWRSLEGKASKSNLRPARLAGVEMSSECDLKHPMTSTPNKGPTGLGVKPTPSGLGPSTSLPDLVSVDDGYEYSIWVSYAEIYLEKIYDLLESPIASQSVSASSTASTTSNMFQAGLGLFSAGGAKAKAMVKGFQTVKRNALSLKHDKSGHNKYVHGMREVRVHSAEEARALLERGQVNRRVFSTLANRASSRSHSVFTIKIIKIRKGADLDDPEAATTSRFSIVDLAGSERVNNTQAFGDRLREAGQINKSLMVLGQCMEVLRKNQERGEGRKRAIVPFRHSKLTELFQSFFVGDGKAVMIVNVNPYETSFDENSHVMKFSAVAKGVVTIKNNVPVPVTSPLLASTPQKKEPRVVRVSMYEGAEEEDVIYEEEDPEEEDEEEDEFVNALLDELSTLRKALFEAQMNTVMAESHTRARVAQKYEAKMLDMERHYQDRMREEAEEAEKMLNAKLDILTRLNAASARLPTPPKREVSTPSTTYDDSDEEGSFVSEDSRGAANTVEKMLLDGQGSQHRSVAHESPSPSASPLATRSGLVGDLKSPLGRSVVTSSRTDDADASVNGDDDEGEEEEQQEDDEEEDDNGEEDEDEEEDEDDEDDEDGDNEDEEASDEYEEEEASESEDEEEFVPAPRRSVGRASNARVASPKKSTSLVTPAKGRLPMVERQLLVLPDPEDEIVLEVSTKIAIKTPAKPNTADDEIETSERDENDELRSLVTASAMKSAKKKRNLGGSNASRFRDADDLDALADSLAPMTPVRKSTVTSRSSLAASVRSLKR